MIIREMELDEGAMDPDSDGTVLFAQKFDLGEGVDSTFTLDTGTWRKLGKPQEVHMAISLDGDFDI